MRKLLIILSFAATWVFSGCSSVSVPFVHSIDIQQGNVVTQKMLDQLEPGLTKRKVRYLMGTPLIVDVFHPNEWVYLYSFQPGGEDRVQRRVSLYFDQSDRLERIDGDVRSTMPETAVEGGTSESRTVLVPAGPVDEDGGYLRSLLDRFNTRSTGVAPTQQPEVQTTPQAQESATVEDDDARSLRQRFSLQGKDLEQASPDAAQGKAAAQEPAGQGETSESFFEQLKRKLGLGADEGAAPPPDDKQSAEPKPAPSPAEPAVEAPVPETQPGPESETEGFFERLKRKLNLFDNSEASEPPPGQ